MPVYVYEHDDESSCDLGSGFEIEQGIKEDALVSCPGCGRPVHRVICPPMSIKSPRSNSELKDLGFTKLVKRDKGVYENVTPRDGESRIVDAGNPGSMPNLRKTISD